MRVLITGATGFLGKYLVDECLRLGFDVLAFGRNEAAGQGLVSHRVQFIKGDFSQKDHLEAAFVLGVDKVIHAGALSTVWGSWEDFYRANVLATQHVVDLCQTYKVSRLVFVSSPSIYATKGDRLGIREDEAPADNRLSPYIRSKIMAEGIVKRAAGLSYTIIRPRGLFGIGDTSIIPRLLKRHESGGIPLVGQGQQMVDVTCVENVAYAIGLMLTKEMADGQVYNITNGEPMPFYELISQFLEEMQVKPRFRRLPGPLLGLAASLTEGLYRLCRISSEPPLTKYLYYLLRYSQTLSIEKAQKELGYQPRMTIAEGIKKYVAHQKS